MAKAALKLVGLGIFYRMNLPKGFDLWFYGKHAREMLNICKDAYRRFKALAPGVKNEFLLEAEQGPYQLGKLNRNTIAGKRHSLDVTGIGRTFLNLGPLTVIPATLYILQREGRLMFDGYHGCVLIVRRNGSASVHISAIARRTSIEF